MQGGEFPASPGCLAPVGDRAGLDHRAAGAAVNRDGDAGQRSMLTDDRQAFAQQLKQPGPGGGVQGTIYRPVEADLGYRVHPGAEGQDLLAYAMPAPPVFLITR